MLDFLERLKTTFPQVLCESSTHPHVSADHASLYSCFDSTSTELEVLNLLHALIRLWKPALVLETGTYHGYGTIALADALKGSGRVVTVEYDGSFCEIAKNNVTQFDLELLPVIDFINGDSCQFLLSESRSFDFVFLDSDLETRIDELRILLERNLLSYPALIAVHDTSPFREGPTDNTNLRQYLRSALPKAFDFPFSRGIYIGVMGT